MIMSTGFLYMAVYWLVRAKYIPFILTTGFTGSNFSVYAKRPALIISAVQLPAPGRPTALLSAYLLS